MMRKILYLCVFVSLLSACINEEMEPTPTEPVIVAEVVAATAVPRQPIPSKTPPPPNAAETPRPQPQT
jgi:hypothetical protein